MFDKIFRPSDDNIHQIRYCHRICGSMMDHRIPKDLLEKVKASLCDISWSSIKTFEIYRHYWADAVHEVWLSDDPRVELFYRPSVVKTDTDGCWEMERVSLNIVDQEYFPDTECNMVERLNIREYYNRHLSIRLERDESLDSTVLVMIPRDSHGLKLAEEILSVVI